METMIARTSYKWSFDVFLSFKGEDTRFTFVSHLNVALRQKGINVFIDDKLSRGQGIHASLLKAIGESRISIVIISENYASSSWCLDELVKIMECAKEVVPIFYKVDPSDVRKQNGTFGEALAKHELVRSYNQIQSWRKALTEISNISAILVRKNEDEANCIKKIVQEVLNKLNRTVSLNVAKYPVGIDFQIQVTSLLSRIMSNGVTMVGIYGIGGMGKTTLAKALYNKIANQFEGCSFLANVRQASKQFNGLVQLQEMLLSEILVGGSIKVNNLPRGINIIKERLHSKRILLILDDIDECQQLEVLAGGHDWFGRGSKIIVTTKDKHLLSLHGFDLQYPIPQLSDDQALELFSWHAFKKSDPSNDYLYLSRRATNYCKGLPLALVVLGSFLCERDQSKWENILNGYENSSLDADIRNILQISYDGLEAQIKEIFLDISCFFAGQKIFYVKMFLEACGSCPEKGLTKLEDLSLINIDQNFGVEMHELIQQMGHTIALLESSNPRKRKRLFTKDDVESVLNNKKRTTAVKAIMLNFPNHMELDIDARGLRNVPNLRFLKVENATFSGDLEYLPNSLKWIDWPKFPFPSFPPSYMSKNLVRLNLPGSFIKHLGQGFMNWKSLKHVDLRGSEFLVEIPDFSTAVNLEKLKLKFCKNLVKVHESIGLLDRLIYLNLVGCYDLEQFPSNLKCKSLEYFDLGHCKRLKQFPHIGKEMKSFSRLFISNLEETTDLKELFLSIPNLSKLEYVEIIECKNLTTVPIYCLTNLRTFSTRSCSSFSRLTCPFPSSAFLCSNLSHLDLSFCNISNVSFLETLSHVAPSLLYLNLSDNKFTSLPSCIVNFTSLRGLTLFDCKFLKEISKVPARVHDMNAKGCISLARFPDNIADMISCNLEYEYRSNDDYRYLVLMNCDIPEWYHYKNVKNSIEFWLPHHRSRKLKAFAPCVIFEVYDYYSSVQIEGVCIECKVSINNIQVWSSYETTSFSGPSSSSCVQYMWLLVIDPQSRPEHFHSNCTNGEENWNDDSLDEMEIPQLETSIWIDSMALDWNNCTVSFEICEELDKRIVNIRRCGVHVVYEE